jgi:hypothetical protein
VIDPRDCPAWELTQRLETENICVQGAESRPIGTTENRAFAIQAKLNAVIAVRFSELLGAGRSLRTKSDQAGPHALSVRGMRNSARLFTFAANWGKAATELKPR